MRKPEQSPTVIHQRECSDNNKTMENKLKSVESLWTDRLKCKYPQGLNWAKYNPTKRYKLLTPLHGEHIAQKMHLQHSPITDGQAKQYKTTINQIFNN